MLSGRHLFTTLALSALVLTAMPMAASTPTTHQPVGSCDPQPRVHVPRAVHHVISCLDDLTTAGTVESGHTVPEDWAGLSSTRTINPSDVPGVQIDGYFPDSSTTNTHHGWDHDAQFVLRLPDDWNGKLVVTGAPGNRRQYSLDATISDWALDRGYAFAATDKGNTGTEFYRDGAKPADAIAEWNSRLTQLTVAAKLAVKQHYGQRPERTYVTGISNGGYLTRWQLENRPGHYDGGVDCEGTLFRADGPNLLSSLPDALKHYPAWRAGSEQAHQELLDAGFAAGSEFLWDFHYDHYWQLTQRIYREEFDPAYDGKEADYDYFDRPDSVHKAMRKIELTGKIRKPMLTLHGTLDSLLPIATDSDVYADLVRQTARGEQLHRYYVIEDGNHTDGLVDTFPNRLRAMLPCYRDAFTALEAWVEDSQPPPSSGLVPHSASGDTVNHCSIANR